MADDVLRHLFLGFIRLHVLYHADKEPICGVELIDELRHHGYDVGPGTLYPVLHQLEDAGYLTSSDEIVEGKRRKNLSITASGKRVLARARAQLRELATEVLDDIDARKQRRK
jgi:DNA-binding PadR family transcriptional regulator